MPRMIDDALKLTIDVMFKKKLNLPLINKESIEEGEGEVPEEFHVEGYQIDQNMWDHIL